MKYGKEFSDRLHFGVANRQELSHLADVLPEPDSDSKNPKPAVLVLDDSERKYVMKDAFA